jgi:hypothetical protein
MSERAAIVCERCDDFGRLPDGPCPDCEIRAMVAEDPTIVVIDDEDDEA